VVAKQMLGDIQSTNDAIQVTHKIEYSGLWVCSNKQMQLLILN